jgi:hypothetical protein
MKQSCFLPLIILLFLFTACQQAEIIGQNEPMNPQEATAQAITARMQAAAGTAEASTTITAIVVYEDQVQKAIQAWEAAGVQSYVWKMSYTDPDPNKRGFQSFEITVQNGVITQFKHDCGPVEVCLRSKVENQADFAIPGVLATIQALAAEQYPMSVVTFNEQYGYPEQVMGNSELAPYQVRWSTDSFKIIE